MRFLQGLSNILLLLATVLPVYSASDQVGEPRTGFESGTGFEIAKQNVDLASFECVSLYVENDTYFSDRYYTNGLKLSYTGAGDDFYASAAQFAFLRLFVDDSARQAFQTVFIGQKMCVPGNIDETNPPLWDRPYAGWLYVGAGASLASENRIDSFSVSLGVVGPISLAEDAQKFFHSIIDADWPMGWHTQIKNEPGIILAYNHSERIFRKKLSENFDTDALVSAGAELGNVMTQGTVRAFWRFGYNVPYTFSPNRIDAVSDNDVAWRPTDSSPDWHCFMYGGGAARFVGYDITLDGNTFAHSRSVVPKWLVGEVMAGISTRYKSFQADLNWTLRTSEFNNQKYPVHMFWSVRLTAFF